MKGYLRAFLSVMLALLCGVGAWGQEYGSTIMVRFEL